MAGFFDPDKKEENSSMAGLLDPDKKEENSSMEGLLGRIPIRRDLDAWTSLYGSHQRPAKARSTEKKAVGKKAVGGAGFSTPLIAAACTTLTTSQTWDASCDSKLDALIRELERPLVSSFDNQTMQLWKDIRSKRQQLQNTLEEARILERIQKNAVANHKRLSKRVNDPSNELLKQDIVAECHVLKNIYNCVGIRQQGLLALAHVYGMNLMEMGEEFLALRASLADAQSSPASSQEVEEWKAKLQASSEQVEELKAKLQASEKVVEALRAEKEVETLPAEKEVKSVADKEVETLRAEVEELKAKLAAGEQLDDKVQHWVEAAAQDVVVPAVQDVAEAAIRREFQKLELKLQGGAHESTNSEEIRKAWWGLE